ncbi:hypothetical protein G6L37_06430 [Agrobacterium rubi]|nr:hypothetical protein [Agrobacterium rubi]NTF24999.1 hypothetical protein [Agrobacterium rubi]
MTSPSDSIRSRLSTFRPSDRAEISRQLGDDGSRNIVVMAIKDFLIGWDNADWQDEGVVERLGRWVAKAHPGAISAEFEDWSRRENGPATLAFSQAIGLARNWPRPETS